MKSLIDGLLQVARLGTYTPQLSRLDMNNLISSIITTAAFRIQQTGAKVTADNLPPCVGDAGQINRVFTNLLDNALKYADPARPPRIHISGRHHDNQCVYCVEDNGIGICPEHQDKVFELFHRLNPKGIIEGEGLGLTIVRRILNMHNGKVWVESVPGQGSKFFVALPDKEDV
ncbi:MAG TPA: ATP-binding protein, partial [Anaerohalosphaeraceae bacterium]|nr:ATP-binding protein [Anaerohalosphaeraceae bacterium]